MMLDLVAIWPEKLGVRTRQARALESFSIKTLALSMLQLGIKEYYISQHFITETSHCTLYIILKNYSAASTRMLH